ncbi:MAG: hypothetical protein NE330_04570 [Lentisphaeraceae bacterium]|nr:hypothetical protein [Lentisphaeraceae bacterium]
MPKLRKTFIIALTIFGSCTFYSVLIVLMRELESDKTVPLSFLKYLAYFHTHAGVFILYLGYSAGLLALTCAGVMWMRKS